MTTAPAIDCIAKVPRKRLRLYQEETLDRLKEVYKAYKGDHFVCGVTATPERSDNLGLESVCDVVIVAPTGSGKTICLSHIPDTLGMTKDQAMLVLVHRDELVWQSCEKLRKYNPTLLVDVEKAEYKCNPLAHIIVASVQTIGKNKKREDGTWDFCSRIQKFDPARFRFIVIDEAHHAASPSYRSVTAYFDQGKPVQREAELISTRDLRELISEGWLATPKAYRIDTHINLDDVKIQHGEFAKKELEKTVNTPERNRLIVQEYLERGEGHKAIAFTVDVQHTVDLVAAFQEEGILAYGITGKTPTGDEHNPEPGTRRWIYRKYNEGAAMVLVSCAVLTEGADFPIATVGLMARPTKSGMLYRQMVGRLLRPFPSPEELDAMKAAGITPKWIKPYCIILDFCDLSSRHTLHKLPTLFGLKPDYNAQGGKILEQVQAMEALVEQKKLPINLADISNMAQLTSFAERVDLFAKPVIPEEVQKLSQFAWYKAGANAYQLVLDKEVFRISEDGLGRWSVAKTVKGIKTQLGHCQTKDEAFKLADGQIPADQRFKVQSAANWRDKGVTDKQVDLLWKVASSHREAARIKREFSGMSDTKEAKRLFGELLKQKYNSGDISMMLQQALPSASKNWKRC